MRKITDLAKFLENRYEKEIGEPWSELEKRVRERHKDLFEMLDWMKDMEGP